MSEEHKTCLVTVVEPGMPDKVIKIRPALHENEKIWLDNRPGIERWQAVRDLMKRFCPRGQYVPDAAYWHQPGAKPEDIGVFILKPEDIPVVTLEGAVFEPLPAKERPARTNPTAVAQQNRDEVSALKAEVAQLKELLKAGLVKQPEAVTVAASAEPSAAPKPRRGRPPKNLNKES